MNARNDQETITLPIKVFKPLAYVVAAFLAGGSGSIAVRQLNPPAYNAFTGDDGKKLQQRSDSGDEKLRRDLDAKFAGLNAAINQINRDSLSRHEIQQALIESKVEDIMEDIHRLEATAEQCRRTLSELPPQWLRDAVSECQADVSAIKAELGLIQTDHGRFFEWFRGLK